MHTYFTLTNQGPLFLFTVLMGHVVSYLIDFQCPVLATASNVNTDDRPWVSFWIHLGRFLLTIWPQAVAVLLLSMQYDMLDRNATGGAQGLFSYRVLALEWIALNATICHRHIMHIPTTQHLIKATVLSAALELIARLLFSHHGFALEDPENKSQDLTDHAEEPVEVDDGCTEIGRLEASVKRRWTWTVRNALSWKKHDAERHEQGQQEEEDSAKQKE